tara:strand:+ start:135 stop:899 length:765 start_codon:yes stop_codon:yes gene_type:complete
MACHSGPNIVKDDSLIFYLDAKNTESYSGSGTWNDLSGFGNSDNATIDGATFNSEGFFDFDGTNDNVKIAYTGDSDVNDTLFNGSNKFTIEFWFKADNLPANGSNSQYSQMIFGGGDRALFVTFGDTLDDKEVGIRMNIGGSWYSPVGTGADSIENNRWYNLLITYHNSDGWVLYLNGLQKATSSSADHIGTFNNYGYDSSYRLIGCLVDNTSSSSYSDRFFDGKIPICRIYNKVLTASEAKQNYDAMKWRYNL